MARGYIYEISKDKESLRNIQAEDFYDDVKSLSIDFVSDEIDVEQRIEDFLNHLADYRFEVDYEEKSFFVKRDDKIRYYSDRYKQLKSDAEKMTLEAFATSDLFTFRNLVMDEYGDVVCESTESEDSELIDWDSWLRAAEENVKYFIGGVVLMH